ncbi:AAA family ATPase [Candidatus Woesearchaeota archaeon]|nr:AAA family ATPase [Candidatus Woesearchaeota archaeon]
MVLGDPVSGKEFFDRNKEMAILFSTLRDFESGTKRNIAIIGLRKIGKTSLITEFIRRLNKNTPSTICLSIYLPEQNPHNFFRGCMGSIINELFRLMKFQPKTGTLSLENALRIIEHDFPRTALAITNLEVFVRKRNLEEAFSYLFDVLEVVKKETGNSLIVFLDEFQRLTEYERDIKSPIDKFRERIMRQKEILYIISGSAVGMLNRLISSTKSPLYGHFERMYLRGFGFKDTYHFIVSKKPITLSIGDGLIGFLYEITNGNPFYLDILVHNMVRTCGFEKKKRVSKDFVEDSLINQIFSKEGSIYSYFDSLIEQSLEKRGSTYYTEILKSIASGDRRPSEISKATNINLTTLPVYLKKLQELEIIRKSEPTKKKSKITEYEFIDSLFELWIKEVYSLRDNPILKDFELKAKIFKNNISKIVNDYNTEIGKGNESRIRELFREFDGDVVGELTIPKFDSVERKDILGEEIDVFCRFAQDVWIAEVSKSNIDKSEIENIKRKIDKVKTKENISQVIVIPTKEINQEAMNLCTKYKFEIWTLGIINKLLKRTGMFRILI